MSSNAVLTMPVWIITLTGVALRFGVQVVGIKITDVFPQLGRFLIAMFP
jgi:hypothetical protein